MNMLDRVLNEPYVKCSVCNNWVALGENNTVAPHSQTVSFQFSLDNHGVIPLCSGSNQEATGEVVPYKDLYKKMEN